MVKEANNASIIMKVLLSPRASLKESQAHPQMFMDHNVKATGLNNTVNNKFSDSISGKRLSLK